MYQAFGGGFVTISQIKIGGQNALSNNPSLINAAACLEQRDQENMYISLFLIAHSCTENARAI